jgi:hypothetical protein
MFGSRKHRVDDDALPYAVPKIPLDTFPIILSFINLTHQKYAKLCLVNKMCYEELQKNEHWISPCRYYFGYKLTGKERESLKEIYIRKTKEFKEKLEIENNRIRLVNHILITNLIGRTRIPHIWKRSTHTSLYNRTTLCKRVRIRYGKRIR